MEKLLGGPHARQLAYLHGQAAYERDPQVSVRSIVGAALEAPHPLARLAFFRSGQSLRIQAGIRCARTLRVAANVNGSWLNDLGRRTLMTIHTRHPKSAKPDKDQSTAVIIAVALLCMTVVLPSG